jgi:hypothetical protein
MAARGGPNADSIDFIDQTVPLDRQVAWVFDLVSGTAAEALDVANRLNIHPKVAC